MKNHKYNLAESRLPKGLLLLPDQNKPNKKSVKVLIITSLLLAGLALIGLLSVWGFLSTWENQGFNRDMTSMTEEHKLNGTTTILNNSTIIVESYYPSPPYTMHPIILKEFSNHSRSDVHISNNEKNLVEQNIKIDSFEIKTMYGDKELHPPYKQFNPSAFPNVQTEGMAKTTLIVNWSYNKTELEYDEDYNINLALSERLSNLDIAGTIRMAIGNELLRAGYVLFLEALPFLFFAISGFAFSWYIFGKGTLMKDYDVLEQFSPDTYQKAVNSEKKEIEASLGNITSFPKKQSSLKRLMFGMSIFMLKSLANQKCKEHYEICDSYAIAPYRLEAIKKTFSKYEKQTFEKIQDMLPELKTILLVTGFIATIGISFSFNIGAAGPFVYSVVLFYVFFNLGSASQFVWKSKVDRFWISITLIVALVVVTFPTFVQLLRVATGFF